MNITRLLRSTISVAAGSVLVTRCVAQTVPITLTCSGTIGLADPPTWPPDVSGTSYTLSYDLMLDALGSTEVSPGVVRWTADGTVTFTIDGFNPTVLTGSAPILVLEDPLGDGRDVIQFSVIPPFGGGWIVTIFSQPGDMILTLTDPPSSLAINMLSPVAMLEIRDSDLNVTLDGSVTDYSSTGGVLPQPPEITTQPIGDIVEPGQVATFTVAADGTDLVFQWRRDGEALIDGPGVSGSDTSSLHITASANDPAAYDVVISSPGGSVTSLPAILAVRETCPADQNFDGVLSPADFNAWVLNFNTGC